MTDNSKNINRRRFLEATALAGVGVLGAGAVLSSCKGKKDAAALGLPPILSAAPAGKKLRAGLVGVGNRGTGAAINFISAGPDLEIVALADVFQDKIDACRKRFAGYKRPIPEENCFVGFDGYKKLMALEEVDVVLLATPPQFRPLHFKEAVKQQKHVFLEKPMAVDPVGVRSVMVSAEKAKMLGLSVVTGTIKRHQQDYIETFKQVAKGEIGEIVSANSYYNVGKLWHRNPRAGWSELENMIRNWVNWCWLSGDHIVEQNVHNLDTVNWFVGKHPEKALGFGARHQRITGDQYDMFSVDFVYDKEVHYHSMCRQINDCSNSISDRIQGSKGSTNCENTIYNPDGSVKWTFDYPRKGNGSTLSRLATNPYDQELIDLLTAIRTGNPVNEAFQIAASTLTGIMGRIAAYTGKEVSWDEMMNSDLYLGPKTYVIGAVAVSKEIPKPGSSPK